MFLESLRTMKELKRLTEDQKSLADRLAETDKNVVPVSGKKDVDDALAVANVLKDVRLIATKDKGYIITRPNRARNASYRARLCLSDGFRDDGLVCLIAAKISSRSCTKEVATVLAGRKSKKDDDSSDDESDDEGDSFYRGLNLEVNVKSFYPSTSKRASLIRKGNRRVNRNVLGKMDIENFQKIVALFYDEKGSRLSKTRHQSSSPDSTPISSPRVRPSQQ